MNLLGLDAETCLTQYDYTDLQYFVGGQPVTQVTCPAPGDSIEVTPQAAAPGAGCVYKWKPFNVTCGSPG